MSITYPDLNNDFPDIYSDARTVFREMTIDDVPHINTFETLTASLLSASTDSDRLASWNAYHTFLSSEDYTKHVEPCLYTSEKLQNLEDMVISAQRFAKRVQQQWKFSELQPEDSEQAVGDIWGKIEYINEDDTFSYTSYQKTSSGYKLCEAHYNGNGNWIGNTTIAGAIDLLAETTEKLNEQLNGKSIRIVDTLPSNPEANMIYLVKG